MNTKPPLKQELPSPYNLDLCGVLGDLNRTTRIGRANLANDPVTAAFLAAGMRLVQRALGPGAERTPRDLDDLSSLQRPLLAFLSQRAVAKEVGNNPDPFPRQGTVAALRDRWKSQSHYIADLLRFCMWSQHLPAYPLTLSDESKGHLDELINGPNSVPSIHRISYDDIDFLLNHPRFRLKLVAAAAAEGDSVIRSAMAECYQGLQEEWEAVCAKVLQRRGLQLRPDVTIHDFVRLLIAMGEGVGVSALADPGAKIFDASQKCCLLGTGVLALIRGSIERTEDADGKTLEQAVSEMMDLIQSEANDG